MNSGKLIFGLFVVFILLGAVHAADYSKEELLAAAKSLGIDTTSGALGEEATVPSERPSELLKPARFDPRTPPNAYTLESPIWRRSVPP